MPRELESFCTSQPQSNRRVNSRNPVIRHDTPAAWKGFSLARRERLPNIEDAKKYKTEKQIFPVERRTHDGEAGSKRGVAKFVNLSPYGNPAPRNHRKKLTRNFINNHAARIFLAPE